MPRIQIRLLKTVEEFRQCEEVQRHVWGMTGASREVLIATQKCDGAVIGTLLDGKVVAFIYAFLGRYHGQWIHWSHQMAVEPEYRDQGFGLRMKRVHRRVALERDIKSICWTFDPLQSRNARLNIARLGAVPEEYIVDCYGRFPSVLERGLPSDRWVVNWKVATRRVKERLQGRAPRFDPALPRVNETRLTSRGFPENTKIRLALKDRKLLVETPSQTEVMRARALPLAERWRMETRRIFQHYLAKGYRVDDFFPPRPETEGRCFYVLRRGE